MQYVGPDARNLATTPSPALHSRKHQWPPAAESMVSACSFMGSPIRPTSKVAPCFASAFDDAFGFMQYAVVPIAVLLRAHHRPSLLVRLSPHLSILLLDGPQVVKLPRSFSKQPSIVTSALSVSSLSECSEHESPSQCTLERSGVQPIAHPCSQPRSVQWLRTLGSASTSAQSEASPSKHVWSAESSFHLSSDHADSDKVCGWWDRPGREIMGSEAFFPSACNNQRCREPPEV